MCGAGTIPIEAALAFSCEKIYTIDIDPDAISTALKNQTLAGTTISFQQGDARELPFEDQSLDRIITNLPWGRQIQTNESLKVLYRAVFEEFERLLKVGGKMVFLTDQHELIDEVIQNSGRFFLEQKIMISLFGSHPAIYRIST